MRKLFTLILAMVAISAMAQTDQMTVYLKNGTSKTYNVEDIDSIGFSTLAAHTLIGTTQANLSSWNGADFGLVSTCTMEVYADGTYTLKAPWGVEGYDLTFGATADGEVDLSTLATSGGYHYAYSGLEYGDVNEYFWFYESGYSNFSGDANEGSMYVGVYNAASPATWDYISVTWSAWQPLTISENNAKFYNGTDVVETKTQEASYSPTSNTIRLTNLFGSGYDYDLQLGSLEVFPWGEQYPCYSITPLTYSYYSDDGSDQLYWLWDASQEELGNTCYITFPYNDEHPQACGYWYYTYNSNLESAYSFVYPYTSTSGESKLQIRLYFYLYDYSSEQTTFDAIGWRCVDITTAGIDAE